MDKIKLLPPEKQKELKSFADFYYKYLQPEVKNREEIAETKRKNFGNMKGQIWMADDFNETPEDFKDYM